MGNMGTSCLKILYTPNTDTPKIASFQQQTNGFCALSQPYCQVDWWTQLFQGSWVWVNTPPPRQEVIIYLEYKCLLKWGFVGTFHLDDDYIPVVNLLDPQKWIGPRGGTVWIPQWGVSGSLPINWMGVAFQKQRHRNRKMMKHEDIQPTPKKTWENGKPSLCYCQLCQTRSSRCLRRNRTWEALVRHWQWANHHPQLSGRKSTSPTSAELVTLRGHGAHGSWIGCESWIKDAFEISHCYKFS